MKEYLVTVKVGNLVETVTEIVNACSASCALDKILKVAHEEDPFKKSFPIKVIDIKRI